MQFTGLHDKNGKEIYEGDIIAFRNEKGEITLKGEIYWESRNAKFSDFSPKNQVEVIGNIYENPELLEESK